VTLLSELLMLPVTSESGDALGTLLDLRVDPSSGAARVVALVVATHPRVARAFSGRSTEGLISELGVIELSAVTRLGPDRVIVAEGTTVSRARTKGRGGR
jgi:sporulation protein YlmC with PRC-barrel domain